MRRCVVGLVLISALLGVGLPMAPVGALDSAAVATNFRDGKSVFKLSFHVKRVMDSDVDADNAAVAYASCTECRTVAASIQVVLAMDDVDSVTTDNVAIAINYECTECETLAAAYQFVFGNGELVRFTAEGNRRLADIRRRLQALRQRDDLTLEELAQEIAQLAAEVAEVVDTELVAVGREGAPTDATSTTTSSSSSSSSTTTSTTSDEFPFDSTTTSSSAP